MKIVAKCSNVPEANAVAAKLRAVGVRTFVHDTTTRRMRPGLPPNIAVSVAAKDVRRSITIIAEAFPHLVPMPDLSICESCRSKPADSIDFDLSLSTRLIVTLIGRLSFKSYCPVCKKFHKGR